MSTPARVAYVETPEGVFRETGGKMEGPFSREALGLEADQFIPLCQALRASGPPVSLSFGFGYGNKADNRFE